MTTNKLAIIGGSGLYDVEEFKERELLDLNTPWGKPSDQILKTNYNNKEVYFLPRHGRGHYVSPTNINFRANIDALKQLGVTDIVSVSAKLIEISGGKVAAFVFVINLFDLGGSDNLMKNNYQVENLIDFPGH